MYTLIRPEYCVADIDKAHRVARRLGTVDWFARVVSDIKRGHISSLLCAKHIGMRGGWRQAIRRGG